MNEYEPLPPIKIEDDAVAVIQISDGLEFHATRNNTVLTTYLGRTAFNNIFIWDDQKSMRLFKEAPSYDELQEYILENNYPMFLNLGEVPAEIQEFYVKTVMQDTPDTMPEDW